MASSLLSVPQRQALRSTATTPLIWTRWTRGSAARLSASAASGWTSTGSPPPGSSALNPHWDASLWSSMFIHNTTLLCDAADQDLLGNYHAISASYLLLDQLACEMGEYMSVGIIRQFHIS
ncbi:MAG: hypothetical protein ACLRWQ_21610 [Flavonifractor plautii]